MLRQARVVDAGAAGLVEYVRGAVAGMQRRMPAAVGALAAAAPPSLDSIHLQPSRYRYCTSFLVEDEGVDRELLESLLEPLGDSLLVVGEPPILKVHLHTDDPGAAISLGVGAGAVADVEVADMTLQVRDRTLRLLEGHAGRAGRVRAGGGRRRRRGGDRLPRRGDRGRAGGGRAVRQSQRGGDRRCDRGVGRRGRAGAAQQPQRGARGRERRRPGRAAGRRGADAVSSRRPGAGRTVRPRPGAGRERGRARAAERDAPLRRGGRGRPRRLDGRRAVTAGQYLALVDGRLQSSHDDAASAAAAVLR